MNLVAAALSLDVLAERLLDRVREKFMARVYVRPDGCWEWMGHRDKDGYGKFVVARLNLRAHRAGYVLFRGPIERGQLLRHTCDYPPCANPDHVVPGTQQQNIADCLARGRRDHVRPPVLRGAANPRARLTLEKAAEIRAASAIGATVSALSREYSVAPCAIRDVLAGRRWI